MRHSSSITGESNDAIVAFMPTA